MLPHAHAVALAAFLADGNALAQVLVGLPVKVPHFCFTEGVARVEPHVQLFTRSHLVFAYPHPVGQPVAVEVHPGEVSLVGALAEGAVEPGAGLAAAHDDGPALGVEGVGLVFRQHEADRKAYPRTLSRSLEVLPALLEVHRFPERLPVGTVYWILLGVTTSG